MTERTQLSRELLRLRGIDADAVEMDELQYIEQRVVEVADAMQQNLDSKYPGRRFHADGVILRDVDQVYDEFHLHDETGVSRTVVKAYETDEGYRFEDDYYGYARADDYEQWLTEVFREIQPELKVYATIYCTLPERYTLDYPISQAADDAAFWAYTWFIVPPAETPFDGLSERFFSRIRELGLAGEFTLYRLIGPLDEVATKQDAFRLIPSHSAERPVYSAMARYMQAGTDRGNE